jgi:hypothetical protein
MRLLFFMFLSYGLLSAGGILDIKWPKANASQQKASAAYAKVLVDGVKDVRLPVYLSSSYAYDKNMLVVSDQGFYSISFALDGAMVLFEGDRTYQESISSKNLEFSKIVQKTKNVQFSKSEEIMTVDFNRHGANYAISIECDKPKTDTRCTQESFVRGLYSSIVMVGGRP